MAHNGNRMNEKVVQIVRRQGVRASQENKITYWSPIRIGGGVCLALAGVISIILVSVQPSRIGPYSLADLIRPAGNTAPLVAPSAPSSNIQTLMTATNNLPSVGSLTQTLQKMGVSVVVSNVSISENDIAFRTLGVDQANIGVAAQSALIQHLNIEKAVTEIGQNPTTGLSAGVALEILDQYLYMAAERSGKVTSEVQAMEYANQQYEIAQKSDPTWATAEKGQFLSSAAISAYERSMTITNEMNAVGGSPNYQVNRTPTLVQWLNGQIHQYSLSIHNVTDSATQNTVTPANVAEFLPNNM